MDVISLAKATALAKVIELPVFYTRVSAGFPSPADDFMEGSLDLNTHLIKHPAATFFWTVAGESMIDAGILPGDILVVDKSIEAMDGHIVVAVLNGDLTLKRFHRRGDKMFLKPENKNFPIITVSKEDDFSIWGVVKGIARLY